MDGSQIEHEQQNVGGVDLPHTPQQPRCSKDEAALEHSSAEDERRGVAGNEHEQIGTVAEAVVSERKPGQYAGGDVAEEHQPIGETAKQVQPQIPLRSWKYELDLHCSGSTSDKRRNAPMPLSAEAVCAPRK